MGDIYRHFFFMQAHLDVSGVPELDHVTAAVGEVDLEGGLVVAAQFDFLILLQLQSLI